MFADLLNTSQFYFLFGDFNSELLAPSMRLRTKLRPVPLTSCVLPTTNMSKAHINEATKNVKLLQQFPLHALSTF
jgi:hypothetical protein